MPEEVTVQSTTPDQPVAATPSAPVGDLGASQQPTDSLASMQDRMSGAFFDEGSGAVVDASGNWITDANGNKFASMEAYRSQQNPQGTNQQQSVGATQQTPATAGIDALFTKDGRFDAEALVAGTNRFAGMNYVSKSAAAPAQQQAQPQMQAAATAQAQPVTPQQEIDNFEKSLRDTRLQPIISEWEEARRTLGDEAIRLKPWYDKRYNEAVDSVNREVRNKVFELSTKANESVQESAQYQVYQRDSQSNVRMVSSQLFPNGGEQAFWALVSGYSQPDGKGGTAFVKGAGAEFLDHLFDMENHGKSFSSSEDMGKAYQNWWLRYSSNPENVKFVAKVSHALYVASNLPKIRDAYRGAWSQEQTQRASVQQTPQPNATAAAPMDGQGEVHPDLARFMGRSVSRV